MCPKLVLNNHIPVKCRCYRYVCLMQTLQLEAIVKLTNMQGLVWLMIFVYFTRCAFSVTRTSCRQTARFDDTRKGENLFNFVDYHINNMQKNTRGHSFPYFLNRSMPEHILFSVDSVHAFCFHRVFSLIQVIT